MCTNYDISNAGKPSIFYIFSKLLYLWDFQPLKILSIMFLHCLLIWYYQLPTKTGFAKNTFQSWNFISVYTTLVRPQSEYAYDVLSGIFKTNDNIFTLTMFYCLYHLVVTWMKTNKPQYCFGCLFNINKFTCYISF